MFYGGVLKVDLLQNHMLRQAINHKRQAAEMEDSMMASGMKLAHYGLA